MLTAFLRALNAQSSTFKYCGKGTDFHSCVGGCKRLLNDGTTELCDENHSSQPCFCFDNSNSCSSSLDCSSSEACIKLLPNVDKSYCAPCDAVPYRSPPPIFVDSNHSCTALSPVPTPYEAPVIDDDLFLDCESSTDCVDECDHLQKYELEYCHESNECFCFTSNWCFSSDECPFGAMCVKIVEDTESFYCVSCGAFFRLLPSPIPADTNHGCEGGIYSDLYVPTTPYPTDYVLNRVCVAAKHVDNMPKSDLVYSSNQRAYVLCDSYGSCATPGHMVLFDEIPMMMKTYCNTKVIQPCVRRIMLVNSPRMAPKLRLSSDSPGLQLTALAAQYETLFEERVLRLLLRNGL